MFEIKDKDIVQMFEHNAYGVTGFKVCVTSDAKKELAAEGVRFILCKKFGEEEPIEAFLARISMGRTQSEIVIHDEIGNALDIGGMGASLSFLYHALARGMVTHCDLALRLVPWYLDETRNGAMAIIEKANFIVQM